MCTHRPKVSWFHGVFCRVPPPQERLPAVPARPEQHNTAASAMPRRAALVPPPPPPPAVRTPLWAARSRQSIRVSSRHNTGGSFHFRQSPVFLITELWTGKGVHAQFAFHAG